MIPKLRSFLRRNFERIESSGDANILLISKNSIVTGEISPELIILKGKSRLINQGHINVVIYSEVGSVINEGTIEGITFCGEGKYDLRKTGTTKGVVLCKGFLIQPGSILDAEVEINVDKSRFIQVIKERLPESKSNRILSAIKGNE